MGLRRGSHLIPRTEVEGKIQIQLRRMKKETLSRIPRMTHQMILRYQMFRIRHPMIPGAMPEIQGAVLLEA